MLWLIPKLNHKGDVSASHIGYMISPLNVINIFSEGKQFGVDNDCYSGKFNKDKFLKLMDKIMPYKNKCLFVNPPDVVGNYEKTTESYCQWYREIKDRGLPISYILQDGFRMKLPELKPDCLFVGGSTEFKLSQIVLRYLQVVGSGYWVHIGRVNSFKRIMHFRFVMDSFDGTDVAMYPNVILKQRNRELAWLRSQLELNI